MKSQLVHIPSMRDAFKQRMKLLTKYLIEVKNLQVYKKLIRSILLFYGFFFLHFVVFFIFILLLFFAIVLYCLFLCQRQRRRRN